MNIIFDEKLTEEIKNRYIVLELDTVKQSSMIKPITLHAIIEYPTIDNFFKLEELIEQHRTMVYQYKNNHCDDAVFNAYALKGSWNGELDEFYEHVIEFCKSLQKQNQVWDGIRFINE